MGPLGSIGVVELMIISVVCCLPILVAVGVVIGLLVVTGRGKSRPAPQKPAPRAPVPAAKAEPVVDLEPEPAPGPKAVTVSDLATRSCPSCGADNPADNSFCEYCGAPLAED